jgi:hypothetical protein
MKRGLILLALAACGGDDGNTAPADAPSGPDAAPRQIVMENVPLPVNETSEAILVGGKGDIARIVMMAPNPSLDWNIHAHPSGGLVVVDQEFKTMNVDYQFKPKEQADWYLLVRNTGLTDMTVALKVELYGNITWSGWQ